MDYYCVLQEHSEKQKLINHNEDKIIEFYNLSNNNIGDSVVITLYKL